MMKIWFRLKEWIRLLGIVAKRGYLIVYQTGIFCIVGWSTASLIVTYRSFFLHPMEALTVKELGDVEQGWFVAVMTNIVSSEANRIIGKGLLMLLIWVLMFLILPLATRSLKRFKLFNLEFEMERPDLEAKEEADYQMEKVEILTKLYLKASKVNLYRFFNEKTGLANYEAALAYFLEDIAAGYKRAFGVSISWQIFEWSTLPREWEHHAGISAEIGEPYLENQELKMNFKKQHVLVYAFHHYDRQLVTVLSSYTHPFDTVDKYGLIVLHHAIADQLENMEYAFWIKKLKDQEMYFEVAYELVEG